MGSRYYLLSAEVTLSFGQNQVVTQFIPKVPIQLNVYYFYLTDLILFDARDFDLILSLDWLAKIPIYDRL